MQTDKDPLTERSTSIEADGGSLLKGLRDFVASTPHAGDWDIYAVNRRIAKKWLDEFDRLKAFDPAITHHDARTSIDWLAGFTHHEGSRSLDAIRTLRAYIKQQQAKDDQTGVG